MHFNIVQNTDVIHRIGNNYNDSCQKKKKNVLCRRGLFSQRGFRIRIGEFCRIMCTANSFMPIYNGRCSFRLVAPGRRRRNLRYYRYYLNTMSVLGLNIRYTKT